MISRYLFRTRIALFDVFLKFQHLPNSQQSNFCYTTKVKAKTFKEVKKFQDIPNVGPAMARDFALLGLHKPTDLINKNPLTLYSKMCKISGVRQDPCVLDTYIAVIDFMNGTPAKPWYSYTKRRKKEYPNI